MTYNGKTWTCDVCGLGPISIKPEEFPVHHQCTKPGARPGDRLKSIFRQLGIDKGKGCHCDEHVRLMNAWGTERCRQEIETIVGWLEEASRERGLPFSRTAARILVRTAIWQAEREVKAFATRSRERGIKVGVTYSSSW